MNPTIKASAPGKNASKPLAILATLMLLIMVVGVYSYHRLAQSIRQDAEGELAIVAQLKGQQIEHWLAEYRTQSRVITDQSFLADEIAAWLASHKRDQQTEQRITQRLERYIQAYQYSSAMLFDISGHTILDHSKISCRQEQHRDDALAVMASGTPRFVDLHLDCGERHTMEFGLVSPIISGNRTIGALYVEMDPDVLLFPLVMRWPGTSASAETLLVRAEGDKLRYLNRLRFSDSPPLSITRSLNEPGLPAEAALRGKLGLIEGLRDYRGKPVLAYAIKVHGTPWIMIAKLDEAEAFAAIRRAALATTLLSGLFMMLTCIQLLNYWQRQLQYQRHQNELQEVKRRALTQHFDYLSRYANDIILLSDEQARIIEANDRAVETYGYSREILLSMNMTDLCSKGSRHLFDEDSIQLMAKKHLLYEAEHQRKDGSVFPIETSARIIETEGKCLGQYIIRDISERKAAEANIKRLMSLYAALSQCNKAIVHCSNEDELFARICHAAVQFGGMKMAWIGLVEPAGEMVRPVASSGEGEEYLRDIRISVNAGSPFGQGPVGTAIRENRPFWCQDFQHDPMTAPWREHSASFGWRASAALPLLRKGIPFGALTLYSDMINAFDEDARNLLEEMAHDISFALNNFDIESEHRRAEAQLALAALAFRQGSEGCIITDADRNIVMVNRAGSALSGFSESEALGQNLRMLVAGGDDDYLEMWKEIDTLGHWQGEVSNHRKDGSHYPGWFSVNRALDAQGRVTHYVGIFNDITKHKEVENRIQRLAHFDALTGLPNRTLLADRANQVIRMAQRSRGPLTLMFLDLDRFKNVNDSLGHRIGDELLKEIAKRMNSAVRVEDTVSRLGGDEFIMVLPCTDADGAAHVARKLLEIVARPCQIEQHELIITPSIGIAMYPGDGEDFDTLSKCADTAMYRAKQGGRNNYRFFTREMQERSVRTLKLENALHHAVEYGQLVLHFQPQVALQSGRVIGAEALVRWEHPELGLVSPVDFIPVAEDSGQILQIGEWVLRTAVNQLKVWMDNGLGAMTMAVNLSAVQFRHHQLPDLVMQILDKAGLSPQYLELELTEGIAMDDPLKAIAVMDILHARGIRMSIDDFGTGYSSLSYIKRFQIDKLKIDQSFVRNMTDDQEDKAIVNAVISLAKGLGVKTIAEGVETSTQLELLRRNGCDEVQGYYFSMPLPADQFEAFVRSRHRA